jgi:hypothetical protein
LAWEQARIKEEGQKRLAEERAAAATREAEKRVRERMAEIANTRVQCPICDNLCSSFATACPRCGHPISSSHLQVPIPTAQIEGLRDLGTLLIVLGLLSLFLLAVGGGIAAVSVCITGAASGMALRGLAGIWMACEVTARR